MVGAQEASRALEGGVCLEPQQMGATFDVQAMRWENLRMAMLWVGWRLTEVTLSLNNIFTFLKKINATSSVMDRSTQTGFLKCHNFEMTYRIGTFNTPAF